MTQESDKKNPTILVLEDDREILEEIEETLSGEGFHTLRAASAREFWKLTEQHVVDLFLIDLTLPDENGLNLARSIRKQSDVGIIIVSGKSDEIDRVVGLEIGADDYVTKPFSPRELVARIRTVLRRTKGSTYPGTQQNPATQDIVEFSGWKLDLSAYRLLAPEGDEANLTTAEFVLLRVFVECPNRVLSRDFLSERMRGREWDGYDRGIDGLVSRLRRIIELPAGSTPLIKTVRGAGYMFTAKVEKRRTMTA